jgi:hypothetical protein
MTFRKGKKRKQKPRKRRMISHNEM